MRKLFSIFLLLALAFGSFANMPTRSRAVEGFASSAKAQYEMWKGRYEAAVFYQAFTGGDDCELYALAESAGVLRADLQEARDGAVAAADYLEQLTGSLASPRGPPVLVAGPPVGQRIAAPATVATGGGSNLFLDESGLGSATAAWSTARKLRSAYDGSCIRVRRSSDNTEQDIGFSSNELDASALTTFCSGTDGYIVTIYDQSGNGRDLTQSTASAQPQIVSSGSILTGANSKPEARSATSDIMATSGNIGISGDITATVFGIIRPTNLSRCPWGWGNTGVALAAVGPIFGVVNAGKVAISHAGGNNFNDSATWSNSTAYSLTYTKAAGAISSTTTVYQNGVAGSNQGSSSGSTPNVTNSVFTWGRWANLATTYDWIGGIQEIVIYNSVLSGGTLTTAHNNQEAFYNLVP